MFVHSATLYIRLCPNLCDISVFIPCTTGNFEILIASQKLCEVNNYNSVFQQETEVFAYLYFRPIFNGPLTSIRYPYGKPRHVSYKISILLNRYQPGSV